VLVVQAGAAGRWTTVSDTGWDRSGHEAATTERASTTSGVGSTSTAEQPAPFPVSRHSFPENPTSKSRFDDDLPLYHFKQQQLLSANYC